MGSLFLPKIGVSRQMPLIDDALLPSVALDAARYEYRSHLLYPHSYNTLTYTGQESQMP
jgi:hypothetical protein